MQYIYQLEEISIEVTNSCPLECIHCSSGSAPQALPGELGFEDHKRLLTEARGLGATVFSVSGGSPLNYRPSDKVHGALPALVNHAHLLGYEDILLYVTGHSRYADTINHYSDIDGLLGSPNVTWIFSFHSHLPSVNDWIMGRPGALREIVFSITWLKELGETVEIHMVPMKPNFRHIPQVRSLCGQLGVSKMSCLRFVPQTRGGENADLLNMSKADFAEMQFILHQEVMKVDHSTYPSVELRLGCPIDFRHAVGLLPEKRKPCHAGDDLILVRPTGDVHPCAAWKSLPVDSNVRDSSLKDIWLNSEVFNTIRLFKRGEIPKSIQRYWSGYQTVGGACGACNMVASCKTGCPAQRLHAGGSHLNALLTPRSDPLCPRGDG